MARKPLGQKDHLVVPLPFPEVKSGFKQSSLSEKQWEVGSMSRRVLYFGPPLVFCFCIFKLKSNRDKLICSEFWWSVVLFRDETINSECCDVCWVEEIVVHVLWGCLGYTEGLSFMGLVLWVLQICLRVFFGSLEGYKGEILENHWFLLNKIKWWLIFYCIYYIVMPLKHSKLYRIIWPAVLLNDLPF